MEAKNRDSADLLAELEEARWQLRVEAALDRLRQRVAAINESSELLDIVTTMSKEYSGLGLETVQFTYCRQLPDQFMVSATKVGGSKTQFEHTWPFAGNPIETGLRAWLAGEDPVAVFEYSPELAAAHMEFIKTKTNFFEFDPDAEGEIKSQVEIGGFVLIFARTASGAISNITWERPGKIALDVLAKFAKAFDLAYSRFEDLKAAEILTREAQIEVSVERVRGQAMAMHSSNDLIKVVRSVRNEILDLGLEHSVASHINIVGNDGRVTTTDISSIDEGGGIEPLLTVLEFDPENSNYLSRGKTGWDRGERYYVVKFEKDEMPLLADEISELDTDIGRYLRKAIDEGLVPQMWMAVASFSRGYLGADFIESPDLDAELILSKFASAFDLAYRRFEDLKEAESQAREAQIEAALERVRAHAMGMQTSEDIGQTTLRLFEEILQLCPSVFRTGLGIMEEGDSFDMWLAGKDQGGVSMIVKGNIVHRGERPEADEMMNAWVQGRSCTFRESPDFLQYARETVFNDPNLVIIPIDPAIEQHLTTFSHQTGFLFVVAAEPLYSDRGEGSVVQRFAGVFDLAYQRYRDLAKAESDYAALLKEKARTETALRDLQATQRQLVEQEKLASLGALTAGIAHEIKNPLNFVNNFAEVSAELMDELAEAVASGDVDESKALLADLRGNAEQIARHGKRADSIVRSMMQHARGGASTLETVDVNTYLEEYIGLAWHGMRARNENFQTDVVREFADNAGSLDVLPQELGRVILNLLNNAFDALKEEPEGIVTVSTFRDRTGVTITVSDNGPGIPEEIRQKIFEPFFTTKATGEGTGLGLSLSHDIITKGHNGSLAIHDSVDGGAEFVIVLPATS